MLKIIIVFISGFLFSLAQAESSWTVMLEGGAVWQHRNDVRISPDSGTYTEFDRFDQGAFPHYRLESRYRWNKRHGLRLVLAPFNISVSGNIDGPVVFDNETFVPGQDLKIDYQFNSWRLGYTYQWLKGKTYRFDVGLTAKLRDAKIRFTQGSVNQEYSNFGFVPLIFLSYNQRLSSSYWFNVEGDLAAAPQGRAIDMALKLRKKMGESQFLGFGYRTLEGGADNDKVFTFSWFNYAVVDFLYHF